MSPGYAQAVHRSPPSCERNPPVPSPARRRHCSGSFSPVMKITGNMSVRQVLLDPARCLQPAQAGHQASIRIRSGAASPSSSSVASPLRAIRTSIPSALERVDEEPERFRIVVHHQNAVPRGGGHGTCPVNHRCCPLWPMARRLEVEGAKQAAHTARPAPRPLGRARAMLSTGLRSRAHGRAHQARDFVKVRLRPGGDKGAAAARRAGCHLRRIPAPSLRPFQSELIADQVKQIIEIKKASSQTDHLPTGVADRRGLRVLTRKHHDSERRAVAFAQGCGGVPPLIPGIDTSIKISSGGELCSQRQALLRRQTRHARRSRALPAARPADRDAPRSSSISRSWRSRPR